MRFFSIVISIFFMVSSCSNNENPKIENYNESVNLQDEKQDELMRELNKRTDEWNEYIDSVGGIDAYLKKVSSKPKVKKIYKKVTVPVTDSEMKAIRKKVVDKWSGFEDWYKAFKEKGFIFLKRDINKFVTKEEFIRNFEKIDTTGALKDWPEVIEKMKKRAETDPEIDEFFKNRDKKL